MFHASNDWRIGVWPSPSVEGDKISPLIDLKWWSSRIWRLKMINNTFVVKNGHIKSVPTTRALSFAVSHVSSKLNGQNSWCGRFVCSLSLSSTFNLGFPSTRKTAEINIISKELEKLEIGFGNTSGQVAFVYLLNVEHLEEQKTRRHKIEAGKREITRQISDPPWISWKYSFPCLSSPVLSIFAFRPCVCVILYVAADPSWSLVRARDGYFRVQGFRKSAFVVYRRVVGYAECFAFCLHRNICFSWGDFMMHTRQISRQGSCCFFHLIDVFCTVWLGSGLLRFSLAHPCLG